MKYLIALIIVFGFTMSSQAHMLWLERGIDQKTKLYFGEYSHNFTEKQEGFLKEFAEAKAIQNGEEFRSQAKTNFFEYSTKGNNDVRVSNDLVHGDMLAQFRAKAGRQSTTPVFELEIVPVQANSNQFSVFFQGKRLSKQEITITADHRWSKKYLTDEQGHFTIETPWKGQYVIETGKGVDESGEYNQQSYKTRFLVATLSFYVQ